MKPKQENELLCLFCSSSKKDVVDLVVVERKVGVRRCDLDVEYEPGIRWATVNNMQTQVRIALWPI